MLWGPLVLAGDLGAAPRRRDDGDGDGVRAAAPEPVALVTDRPVDRMVEAGRRQARRVPGAGVARTVVDAGADRRRVLAVLRDASPHLRRVLGSCSRRPSLTARARRAQPPSASACARSRRPPSRGADPGDREGEKKFNQQGVETSVIRTGWPRRPARDQWFSYDLPVNGAAPWSTLVATYNSDQRRPRSFDVLVNGTRVGSETQPQSSLSQVSTRRNTRFPRTLIRAQREADGALRGHQWPRSHTGLRRPA